MRRRTFLQSVGAGAAGLGSTASLAGCITVTEDVGIDPASLEDAEPLDLRYPEFRASYYTFSPTDSEPASAVDASHPLSAIEPASRLPAANAIARELFLAGTQFSVAKRAPSSTGTGPSRCSLQSPIGFGSPTTDHRAAPSGSTR